MRGFFRSVTLFELCSTLGGRPTVGPQTLNLLIGVQIPASQSQKAPMLSSGPFLSRNERTTLNPQLIHNGLSHQVFEIAIHFLV